MFRENVRGVRLQKVLDQLEVLDNEETQFVIGSMVLVLEYLHNKHIIIRDLKPGNITIDEEGYMKLSEFKTCKELDGNRAYDFVGTPQYSAPEVFQTHGYDYAADFWSLGVCLY